MRRKVFNRLLDKVFNKDMKKSNYSNAGSVKAVIRYPGSKWGIARWIISHFPAGYENMLYLEPFFGSGAVFFNKAPGKVETINDLDSDVVNLFRVLREQADELRQMLELTPYSREEYDRSFEPCDDPVEMARRFVVRTTQAIGPRLDGKCGWRNHKTMKIGGTACKWGSCAETIEAAAARLRGDPTHLVQIEHMDALRLIERYNDPGVLMYIDPPYIRSLRKGGALYRHEMSYTQHMELLRIITESRARIIISGYDDTLYDTLLSGWYKDSIMSHTTSAHMAKETIWQNFEPPEKQLCFPVE